MRATPLLFLPLVLVGCGRGERAEYAASARADAPASGGAVARLAESSSSRAGEPAQAPIAPRLVVRNADLTLRVESVERAERSVAQVAASQSGGLEASQGSDLSGPNPTLSLTLRVPEGRFDATLAALERLGTRLNKTVSSEDVTDQAVDLDARLKSLRVQEGAYRAILAGARRIPDVLEVQERLTGVRTEIERIVAQRRGLGDRAARSRVTVTLMQASLPTKPAPEPDWMAQTWGDATGALRATGRQLASLGLWLVAMMPVWLPLALVGAWAYRRVPRGG